jgi:ubiquitin C-terminal hydrolase
LISKNWHKKWKKYVTGQQHIYRFSEDLDLIPIASRVYPGPITNEDILFQGDFYKSNESDDIYNTPIRFEARERYHYKVVTVEQWELLFGKYGGVPVKRNCYKDDIYAYHQPEISFEQLNLLVFPPRDNFAVDNISAEKPIFVSKRWNIKEVKDRIIKVLNQNNYGFHLTEENCRLWRFNRQLDMTTVLRELEGEVDKIRTAVINNTEPKIEENTSLEFPGVSLEGQKDTLILKKLYLSNGDKFIIEQANDKGEFIFKFMKGVEIGRCEFCYQDRPLLVACRCKKVFYCSTSCLKKDVRFHEDKCTADELEEDLSYIKKKENSNMGITGLQNLGNTCYMNSGLQCLSNTSLLSRYFLEDLYLPDINTANLLGTEGRLAKSFAKLIKMLWYETETVISPSFFKRVLGKFYSNFKGFSQQDGQELIISVLDALHEDLNRVRKKPYVESNASTDPNDNSMVASAWYNYLARNQSIIVDLLHGQYKSVLRCPRCLKYSITFDPFSTVPLPVPAKKERIIKFFYVPYNISKSIIKSVLTITKTATVDDVRERIAQMLNVPKYGSTFVLLSAKTFDKYLCKDQRSKMITKTGSLELYVQEINPKYFYGPEYEGIEERKKIADQPMKLLENKNQETKSMTLNDSDSETTPALSEEIKKTGQEREETKGLIEETKGGVQLNLASKEKIKDNDDYNSGLCDDMLRVCLSIFSKVSYPHWTSYNKERKTFNRLIHLHKSFTMKELHVEVFRYFRPLFEIWYASNRNKQKKVDGVGLKESLVEENKEGKEDGVDENAHVDGAEGDNKSEVEKNVQVSKAKVNENIKMNDEDKLQEVQKLSDEEFFNLIFPDVNEENWETRLKQPNEYPYELRFVNFENRYAYNREKCPYCNSDTCENCLVPFNSVLKLQDLLNKFNKDLKNDYYYYNHPYSSFDRKEFELEVIFNEDANYWKLDLNQIEKIDLSEDLNKMKEDGGTRVSIYSCFEQFSTWEVLDKNNAWYCPTCKDLVEASKRMQILRCPPVLVLHLKRFKMKEDITSYRAGSRLSALVEFPLRDLDLRSYVNQENAVYDLYAVSNHYGSTDFGHYTAFALNGGVWYKFDDSSVYKVDEPQICSTAAYVLFYKRKDIKDDIDYESIRQVIPEWYKVPVIETGTSKPKVETTVKEFDGETRPIDGSEGKMEDGVAGTGEASDFSNDL